MSVVFVDVCLMFIKMIYFGFGNFLSIFYCSVAYDKLFFIVSMFNLVIFVVFCNVFCCDCDVNGGIVIIVL